MNATVQATISAELAKLAPLVETPVEPFGYGSDLSCVGDLDPNARELDGFDRLVLAEALIRRITTTRGSLPGDADYGIDVRSYLNRGTDVNELRNISDRVQLELLKDDRIVRAQVTATFAANFLELDLDIRITPLDPSVGGFSLTLAVTSADAVLKELRS